MSETIGIVIPIYNVEQYLPRCLDSIISQSYKNLEVILVDDGSTDCSPSICDKYAKKDSRFIVYHKINGGVSDARNFGIKQLSTKYFTMIDPDDFVKSTYIENLLHIRDGYNCEIAVTSATKIIEGGIIKDNQHSDLHITTYGPEKALEILYYRKGINIYPHGKLYPKEFFETESFRTGEIFEDLSIMHRIFSQAKRIGVSQHSDYYYVQRPNSIINSKFNVKKMVQIPICEEIVSFVSDRYPNIIASAKSKYFVTSLNLYVEAAICNATQEQLAEIRKSVLKYNKEVSNDKNNSFVIRLIGKSVPFSMSIVVQAIKFLRWAQKKGLVSINKPF